jgi:hypothetical protein
MACAQWLYADACAQIRKAEAKTESEDHIINFEFLGISEDFVQQILNAAAEFGGTSAVKWVLAHSRLTPSTAAQCVLRGAARSGDIDLLNWAKNYLSGPQTGSWLIGIRTTTNVTALRWFAAQIPGAWSGDECRQYAGHGRLDLIQYARTAGCPWAGDECQVAASEGYIALLKWLRDAGAPFDIARVYEAALDNGHTNITTWLSEEINKSS